MSTEKMVAKKLLMCLFMIIYLFYNQQKEILRRQRVRMFHERQKKQKGIFIAMLLLMCRCQRYFVKRSIWVKPRSGEWWDTIVSSTFDDNDWKENFRLSKRTFIILCNHLRRYIEKCDTRLRPSISVEKSVAMTLWKLATSCEYRTIGHLFGVARGTACVIVNDVCKAIVKVLLKKYIKLPQGQRLLTVVNDFETKFGYPQCFGAIDGTHIAPEQCPKDYYNRKGYHSILMQGVVDSNYCFSDIYIGWPGSVHDARMFCSSNVFKLGESGKLVPRNDRINNIAVPLDIINW